MFAVVVWAASLAELIRSNITAAVMWPIILGFVRPKLGAAASAAFEVNDCVAITVLLPPGLGGAARPLASKSFNSSGLTPH
jgi:hypothetical protein